MTPLVRHNISVPFNDGLQLRDFYAELFDSAQKSIRISTPYFRPTKRVGDALFRAIQRGVKVTLINRLDLDGDTADFILSDVNKDGVNQFYKSMQVLEYTEPKVILHSKLVLIDDRLSFLGSRLRRPAGPNGSDLKLTVDSMAYVSSRGIGERW